MESRQQLDDVVLDLLPLQHQPRRLRGMRERQRIELRGQDELKKMSRTRPPPRCAVTDLRGARLRTAKDRTGVMYDVIYINRAGRVRADGAERRHPDRRLAAERSVRDGDLTRWERAWQTGEALVLGGVLLLAVLVSVAVLADLARA
jgi:hypothetical protein